ncbi:sugar phosphate isomerase/epimerase family protein [Metabacillus sp. HB246100]
MKNVKLERTLMMNYSIAVQLYTLLSECEKDFYGTLSRVSALGFQGVELAGYYGKDAKELKGKLDELQLKAVSSHVPLERLEGNLLVELNYLKELNCKHIVCPFLKEDRRDDYLGLAKSLNRIGKVCKENGITLSYHNHEFELEKELDKTYLELLFENTHSEYLQAELDVYWLTFSGENPIEWMNQYKNRMSLIHLKDMTTDNRKTFAELGTGGVNLEGIMNKLPNTSIEWVIIEQDKCEGSPFESIEKSIKYLEAM